MESKKDIGNYFKENLEQLDYSPSNKVWEGIEVELKKKKKRRFIFWMFFAVIAFGGLSTYTYFNNSNSEKPSINNVSTTNSNDADNNANSDNNNSKNANLNDSNSNNSISDNDNNSNRNELTNDKNNNNAGKNSLNKSTNSVVNKNSNKASGKNSVSKTKPNNSFGVADNDKRLKNNLSTRSHIENSAARSGVKNPKHKKESKVDSNSSSLFAKTKSGKHSKKGKKSDASNTSKESAVLNESNNSSKDNTINPDALKTSETVAAATSENQKEKKLSLDDLKKANQKKRDSIVAVRKAEKEKKDLAQKPKEEEKDSTKTVVEESGHEIIFAPYYGYNYNGNFGNGNFLNNGKTSKKSSKFETSYGLLVRWMGTDKVGVQIGVGIINSTYSATFEKTNNFMNPNNVSLDFSMSDINEMFADSQKITSTYEASYIEVPVEGYYIFADKKFGYATAFGISFLTLQNNKLFLESENVNKFKAGELKNISPFSFSANIKLNLFYRISKRLQFDLYPSFQYQIMGFKDVSNYHPYFFSVKTGFSYKY